MNFNMLAGGAGGQNVTFRVSSLGIQETVLEGNATAESETTGNINYVPKDGSNQFSASGILAYTDDNFEGTNLDQELMDRGARTPSSVRRIWDYGVGIGGPIKQDRLWFYNANRYWGSHNAPPNAFWNATQSTVPPFRYTPDLSRPAFEDQYNRELSVRLTLQASERHKLTYSYHFNRNCNCFENVSSANTPEASDSPRIATIFIRRRGHFRRVAACCLPQAPASGSSPSKFPSTTA